MTNKGRPKKIKSIEDSLPEINAEEFFTEEPIDPKWDMIVRFMEFFPSLIGRERLNSETHVKPLYKFHNEYYGESAYSSMSKATCSICVAKVYERMGGLYRSNMEKYNKYNERNRDK